MSVTCYYHKNCLDGFTSAWLVKKKHPEARLVEIDYGEEPTVFESDTLYIVDFTFPDTEDMNRLIGAAAVTYHYDHHGDKLPIVDALLEEWEGTERYHSVFDTSRSGAGIVWDELHPDQNRPWLVEYVEDRDLWKHDHTESRIFGEGLKTMPYTVADWDYANTIAGHEYVMGIGVEAIKRRLKRCQHQIAQTTRKVGLHLPDGSVVAVPVSELKDGKDASEQTNMMLDILDSPVVMGYVKKNDGKLRFRVTVDEKQFVASDIAKLFGGGGHPGTAGFEIDSSHDFAKQIFK